MNRKIILLALLIGAFSLALVGCGGGSGGGSGGSAKTYAGAMPIGDYVAVTLNETNQTLTYHNYTTGESFGPISYSKLTTGNGGFQNIYQTETFTREGNQCYADFVIMKDVALSFLLFDATGPVDWPVYAFYRQAVNINDYKGRAYNWLKCEISESGGSSDQGNFECGFAAFDTDVTGRIYGASYNRRAEEEVDPNPIKTINESGIGASSFTYDPALVANTSGDLTLIGTPSSDFALDFGAGNGAGFAVRQAASKDWDTNYNGDYFAMVYKNGNSVGADYRTPRYLVKPMWVGLSGSGSITVTSLDGVETYINNESLVSLADFTHGPITDQTVTASFQDLSHCESATSTTVQQAYQCHGSFIYSDATGSQLVNIFSDPNGRFIFFNAFIEEGAEITYFFGFGIKDPNYQP